MLACLFDWEYDYLCERIGDVVQVEAEDSMFGGESISLVKAFEMVAMALKKMHPELPNHLQKVFNAPPPKTQSDGDWVQISFAEQLKKICVPISGLDYDILLGIRNRHRREMRVSEFVTGGIGELLPDLTGRALLELIGTECFRSIDDDFWIKVTHGCMLKYLATGINVIIPDVRFKNEIAMVLKGGFLICVARSDVELVLTELDRTTHVSKWEFLTRIADAHIVMNDGSVDDLQKKVMEIIEILKRL